MFIVDNISNRVDELTGEIMALQDRFNESKYPERHNLRIELRELRAERLRLRELHDEIKTSGDLNERNGSSNNRS